MTRMCLEPRWTNVLVFCIAAALTGCSGAKSPGGGQEETGGDPGEGGTGGGAPASGGKGGGTGGSAVKPDAAAAPADTSAPMGGTGGSSPGPDAGRDLGGGSTGGTGGSPGDGGAVPGQKFSFFVTSMVAMKELSKSPNGFGGDLRFGEATGLAGADKICATVAERGLPGAGQKQWRAFLSASTGGPNGGPTHAIDRIGAGPWYDRMGRLFAMNKAGLLAGPRPAGDPALVADFPNENGVPNKMGTDNHDTLTASNKQGMFVGGGPGAACNDWTSSVAGTGRPMIGHSWPRSPSNLSFGGHWISDHSAPGCAAGINISSGGSMGGGIVGGGGGYGGIYCFALTP